MEINFYTEAELIKIYDVSSITVVRAFERPRCLIIHCPSARKRTFVLVLENKLVEFSDL